MTDSTVSQRDHLLQKQQKMRSKVRALTFDLDDTLYDNRDCMKNAESAFAQSLMQALTVQGALQPEHTPERIFAEYQAVKEALIRSEPSYFHDVVACRRQATSIWLQQQQMGSLSDCEAWAEQAMSVFIDWRNRISIDPYVHTLLAQLSARYPLAVISNGNADIEKIGLSPYFQFALRAGPDGRAKPNSDLFHHAAQRLNCEPSTLVHIGDHLEADVNGARQAGLMSIWLRPSSDAIIDPDVNDDSNLLIIEAINGLEFLI